MQTISTKNDEYTIGVLVGQNHIRRNWLCYNKAGRELIVQIAVNPTYNAQLSRNAWFLDRLGTIAAAIEQKQTEADGRPINYALGFPEIIESFITDTFSTPRQVNILGFRGVEKVSSLIPLIKIWDDSLRVDLRTSAWIMGKLLKAMSFAHDNRIELFKMINGNNILIEPDQHYVVLYDWSSAILHEDAVPASDIREEIKNAAQLVIKALGDNLDAACTNNADLPYTTFLNYLATEGMADARKAHESFYKVVDSLCDNPESTWEKGHFHKFTTLTRSSRG